MIEEMTHRLVKFIRGALLPTTLPQAELSLYGGWESKTELSGSWLTQIIHTVRFSRRLEARLTRHVLVWEGQGHSGNEITSQELIQT